MKKKKRTRGKEEKKKLPGYIFIKEKECKYHLVEC